MKTLRATAFERGGLIALLATLVTIPQSARALPLDLRREEPGETSLSLRDGVRDLLEEDNNGAFAESPAGRLDPMKRSVLAGDSLSASSPAAAGLQSTSTLLPRRVGRIGGIQKLSWSAQAAGPISVRLYRSDKAVRKMSRSLPAGTSSLSFELPSWLEPGSDYTFQVRDSIGVIAIQPLTLQR